MPAAERPSAATGLEERILGTLALAESRGYNLTLEDLSARLLGGPAPVEALRETVHSHEGLDFDGTFVGLKGRLRAGKCARRKEANSKWLPLALSVAQEYARDLVRLCPHVRCVMLSGSAASGGFCPEDDIDLNIVVRDGTKYTSYVAALLLSLRFSVRFGRSIGSRYVPGVPKVICLNVVWEERQAIPFARRDAQLAFELLNTVPI
jgi:predicted nucleotidyltransferase